MVATYSTAAYPRAGCGFQILKDGSAITAPSGDQESVAANFKALWDSKSRAATVVVAANDSSAAAKAGADYVCDGTADDVQIQAALASLPVIAPSTANEGVGGRVLLLAGTYTLATTVTLPRFAVLEGEGMFNSTLQPAIGWTVPGTTEDKLPLVSAVYRCTVKNLNFFGRYVSDSIQCGGLLIDGASGSPIDLRWNILNNQFTDLYYTGLYLIGCDESLVMGNSFIGNQCHSLHPADTADSNSGDLTCDGNTQYLQVFGNSLVGGGRESSNGMAFQPLSASNIICNNFEQYNKGIFGCIGNYVQVSNGDVVISGNSFCKMPGTSNSGNDACGIRIYSSRGFSITNNTFYRIPDALPATNAAGEAISLYEVDGFIVTGNFIDQSVTSWPSGGQRTRAWGIYLESACTNGTVHSNCIINPVTGAPYNYAHRQWFRTEDLIYPPGYYLDSTVHMFEHHVDTLVNVHNADVDYCHANVDGTGSVQTVTTALTQPDVPRCITFTHTGSYTTPTAYSTIIGTDARGRRITETVALTSSGTSTSTKAYATVISFTVPAAYVAAHDEYQTDYLSLGIANTFGLSNPIVIAADVYKVTRAPVGASAVAEAVGTATPSTATLSFASITDGDTLVIHYRTNDNILV